MLKTSSQNNNFINETTSNKPIRNSPYEAYMKKGNRARDKELTTTVLSKGGNSEKSEKSEKS